MLLKKMLVEITYRLRPRFWGEEIRIVLVDVVVVSLVVVLVPVLVVLVDDDEVVLVVVVVPRCLFQMYDESLSCLYWWWKWMMS